MFNTVFASDVQQTLDHFRKSVDRIFGDLPLSASGEPGQERTNSEQVFSPVLESGWNESELSIRAILPGVGSGDVQVSVRANELVIEGRRQPPAGWSKGAYTQLAYGRFYASVALPQGLDVDRANCRLQNGLLEISIPLTEQMKPRQIPIQTEVAQRTISA